MNYDDDPNYFCQRFPEIKADFEKVQDMPALRKLRKAYISADRIPAGVILYFYNKTKERLAPASNSQRSANEARIDRILNIRNSDGKASSRKWN